MVCYLAGMIHGSVIKECKFWRRKIVEHYMNWKGTGQPYKDLYFLDPCCGEENVSSDGMTSDLPSKTILDKDYNAVKKCDLLVVNMDTFGIKRAPVGTIIETAFAYEFRKPIIMITDEDVYLRHPFVSNMVSWYFKSVDEMLNAKAINHFYKGWVNPNYEEIK
jgi:nucleoside 2-deoxyribosyltransferase